MRLLDVSTLELHDFDANIPQYAILSHRWSDTEVSLREVQESSLQSSQKSGAKKIRGFCREISRRSNNYPRFDAHYAWVDTCCINKESSAELSEAINSMYQWYKNANYCCVHLADVDDDDLIDLREMPGYDSNPRLFERLRQSVWFQRGWTLQELLAPQELWFFSRNWKLIGSKRTLRDVISTITGIDGETLLGADVRRASVARRMSWASHRKTTRKEDLAYCLLGLFGVNMPLLYGEGDRAFTRLQEEIMKNSDDQSIFAWEDLCDDNDEAVVQGEDFSYLRGPLAKSPAEFRHAGDIIPFRDWYSSQPYAMTNYGLRIELPIYSVRGESGSYVAALACHYQGDFGGTLGIHVRPLNLSRRSRFTGEVYSDQFARDHRKRRPTQIDPKTHFDEKKQTIYLRKDVLVPSKQDVNRQHSFLVYLHPPAHGFEVCFVDPYDHWMQIRGAAAIILSPINEGAVVFRQPSTGLLITVIMHLQDPTDSQNYEEDYSWESFPCRCKVYVSSSPLWSLADKIAPADMRRLEHEPEPLKGLDVEKTSANGDWIFAAFTGTRLGYFAETSQRGAFKSYAELPVAFGNHTVVAEMRKATVMGERMVVCDVHIHEENQGLFELASVPAPNADSIAEELAPSQDLNGNLEVSPVDDLSSLTFSPALGEHATNDFTSVS